MQYRWSRFLLFVWLFASCEPALGADTASVRKDLKTAYDKRIQMIRHRALSTYSDSMTANFVWKTSTGLVYTGKKPFLDLISLVMDTAYQAKTHTFTINALTLKDKEATATVTERIVNFATDRHGKPHKKVLVSTFREVWTRTTKGWKTKEYDEMYGSLTVDGKLISSHSAATPKTQTH